MGYCYDQGGRLVCDGCSTSGGVRKRTCPYKVRYPNGGSLPYCYPSALCAACYQKHKATLHDHCEQGAAARTAEERAKQDRLDAGEYAVRTCWGSWCTTVPEGYVGVLFGGTAGAVYKLVTKDEYQPDKYLSEHASAQPWDGPPNVGAVTKGVQL